MTMHNSLTIAVGEASPRSGVARLASWTKDVAVRVVASFVVHQQRKELLSLDARMLSDIGLTREDVRRETGRSFWDAR